MHKTICGENAAGDDVIVRLPIVMTIHQNNMKANKQKWQEVQQQQEQQHRKMSIVSINTTICGSSDDDIVLKRLPIRVMMRQQTMNHSIS